MRLKSKATALVALLVLTATPRVFDRMADLKNRAADRFRNEVLNVFWNLTTPDAHSADAAKQYSELLARAQQQNNTPLCDGPDEIASARITRATNSAARTPAPALDLEHRQPFDFDESSTEHPAAGVAIARSEKTFEPDDAASLEEREDLTLVARNFRDYPVFDEFSAPVALDDSVAQFEFNQRDETAALPEARPTAYPARAFPNTKRFAQKFVYTNFQVQLPEKLDGMLNNIITNTDALNKLRDINTTPPKPRCRVRVLRLVPEAPRPLEKPAIIS